MPGRWTVAPGNPDREATLREELGVSVLLASLLVRRGLADPGQAERFLNPRLSDGLRPPSTFGEMPQAVDRLLRAIDGGERIVVYGDYDVDGITGASELVWFLREQGRDVEAFVPHRVRDGYGLRPEVLRRLGERGGGVLVTVDCGANAHAEIELARTLGFDVIVCDHHQVPETRPPALAVLNPVAPDVGRPYPGLSAAGVVFYLLGGLRAEIRRRGGPVPDLKRYLDLVALGTVADVVPLLEENRVLVAHGIRELERTDRPGVRALREVSRVGRVSTEAIGFRFGPRLNAGGRVAEATLALDLLTCREPTDARRLAEILDRHNLERREIESRMTTEAIVKTDALEGLERRRSLVLGSPDWHVGVIGIVAARMVERYGRPVIVLAEDGSVARGSVRGVPGGDVHAALRECAEVIDGFGGHPMAAGLTVATARLPELEDRFEAAIRRTPLRVPETRVDVAVRLADVDAEAVAELARLEPSGAGNPAPRLATFGAEVIERRVVGERHLRLRLREPESGETRSAIAFGRGAEPWKAGDCVDIVFLPRVSEGFTREGFELEVREIRKHSKL